MEHKLDDLDKQILQLLQEDARNNTNSHIAEKVSVSPSTLGKRVKKLEQAGIIEDYYPTINYDIAGFPHHLLFICTAPVTSRGDLVQEVVDLPGVVNVRELMTGQNNIHIEVVAQTNEDITELALAVNELGIQIGEEVNVKNEHRRPASIFK